jgi:hypothetical protein
MELKKKNNSKKIKYWRILFDNKPKIKWERGNPIERKIEKKINF